MLGRILEKRDPSQTYKAEEFVLQGIKILEKLGLVFQSYINFKIIGSSIFGKLLFNPQHC